MAVRFQIEPSSDRRWSVWMGQFPIGYVVRTPRAERHGLNRNCYAATNLRGQINGRSRSVEAAVRLVWGSNLSILEWSPPGGNSN